MSEDKKYVHLGRDTVHLFAEQVGVDNVKDEACGMVAEDCGYRLREATALAAQLMRKNRRKKLTTEDFNRALKSYDVEPIVGYGSASATSWKQVPRGDSALSPEGTPPLSFADDRDLNVVSMALSSATITNVESKPPLSVTSHWLTQEQYPRVLTPAGIAATNAAATSSSSSMSPSLTSASSSPQPHGSPTRKSSSSTVAAQQKKINDALLAYYEATTKAILGKEETVMKVALEDMRTNPRIGPLLPYFVNFVSTGVKTLSHDVGQLKKLLHAAKAILRNRRLDLTPKPYLESLLASVAHCLLEPLSASNGANDHWALRDYAAQILMIIIEGWSAKLPYLKDIGLNNLHEVITDASRPLCSVYGAVVGLANLGSEVIESHLLVNLTSCVSRLDSYEHGANQPTTLKSSSQQRDVYHVRGALISAIERYSKFKSAEFRYRVLTKLRADIEGREMADGADVSKEDAVKDEAPNSVKTGLDVGLVYQNSYHHFGDSLAARLDSIMNRPRTQSADRKPTRPTQLYDDPSEEMSGGDMLDALKRQAAEEQKKRVKEEEDEEEEDDDEDRSYESDEKSDPNGDFGDDSVVVKSQISDPGQGIKLTLKLTKRSRSSDTHSSAMSGDAALDMALPPPHKKKKRNRSSRESSAHLSGGGGGGNNNNGTPSPAASSPLSASSYSSLRREPVFQEGEIRFARPPKIDFRVLGMNQRQSWELSRAPRWNMEVRATVGAERNLWKKSGDRRTMTTAASSPAAVVTGKMKKICREKRLDRVSRSCSLFSVI